MDRQETLESIVRLTRAEAAATAAGSADVRAVRERLEASVGPTIRPADAARLLGISRPAVKRWLDRGDIPSVLTPSGRREVPVPEVVALRLEVDEAREAGRERALAATMKSRRQRAAEIDVDRLLPRRRRRTHRMPETHGLAYHRLVAERLTPQLVDDARARVRTWRDSGHIDGAWADEWLELLDRPLPQIARALGSASGRARARRQTSPFAGLLTVQERRRLIEAIEARG